MSIYKRGKIKLSWDSAELENLSYMHPEDATVGFWFLDGTDLDRYKNIINADISRGFPYFIDLSFIENYFSWLDNKVYAVSKMLPGNILPYHIDRYTYFKKSNDLDSAEPIVRIILFLEDHKPGHILEIDGDQISNWKAGEWVAWKGQTPHLAANLGHSNRFTLQITGTIYD